MWLLWWLLGRIPCQRQRVLLNFITNDAPAIRGVLWSQSRGWLVMKDAVLVPSSGPAVPMDGDVIIECAKVLFVQVVSPS